MGRRIMEYQEYIKTTGRNAHVNRQQYINSPATAFLKYVVEAKSSIQLCINQFPRYTGGKKRLKDNSQDCLEHLIIGIFPAIMGHFETYQRMLLAGLFDYSIYFDGFTIEEFGEKLNKRKVNLNITLFGLSGYRGLGVASVGTVLTDSLSGWQTPKMVNTIYRCFFESINIDHDIFDSADLERLSTLWQLRHAIVHTGGTITIPDSQKVNSLHGYGNKQVVFQNSFITEVARKMHSLIFKVNNNVRAHILSRLLPTTPPNVRTEIDNFLSVNSSVSSWLV